AVLVMLCGELADGAVIQDRPIGQHVVAVPRQPVEDVLLLHERREPGVAFGDAAQPAPHAPLAAAREFPRLVLGLAIEEVLEGRAGLLAATLLEIPED